MKHSMFGIGAMLLATLLWGMTFAFIKDAVTLLTPFDFLFWRFGIASLLLGIFFSKKIKFNQRIFLHGFVLGIFLTGTVVFQTIGLRYTTASTASFITALSVIFVALIEPLLKNQRPTLYLIGSTLLALTGVGLITLSDGVALNQGDLWILLCAVCFAGYILFAGRASHLHQPLSLTFIQSIFVCLIAGSASLFTSEIALPKQLNVWGAILFCSIFASLLAFILQLRFQKYISSTKAAIIFSLEPVFATITAAIYLDERLTFQFFLGALMILIAIFFSEKSTRQKVIPQE